MIHEDDELDDMQGMDAPEPTICPHCGGTGGHPYLPRSCSFCGGSGELSGECYDTRYRITKFRATSDNRLEF